MFAAAAASAFVRRSCLFGGAAACSSGDALSRLKSSRCWHWGWGRGYLSQTLPNPDHNPQNKIEIQKQKVPWLMLSSSTKPESRYLYDLLTVGAGGGQLQAQDGDDGMPLIALNREIHLPKIAGHLCIGSSQGYLITVDRNAEIHATNPFTGGRLPLPSTATLPNMIGVVRDLATGYINHYISSAFPESPEIVPINSEDSAGITKHDSPLGRLAFARLGGDNTSSWTELPSSSEVNANDIILHKGQLHAIDHCGTLSVYDMENLSAQPFCSSEGPLFGEDGNSRSSVVESADGDDLFLVLRDLDFEDESPRTQGFKVFKLDKSDYKWNRVDSVGDLAFFEGFYHTMSLSARNFCGLKPNCIYFTDDNPEGLDTGVFNLKDGSIQFFQFSQFTNGFQELNWPPPVWFMPAMC